MRFRTEIKKTPQAHPLNNKIVQMQIVFKKNNRAYNAIV